MATGFQKIVVLLCVFPLYVTLPSIQTERHSLYYIYTALSKPVDLPGIYEFSAMGLLDDRQIDYYNSKEKRMIHKQQWMKEKMTEEYWKDGTWYRKRKGDVFKQSLKNLKKRMYQSESDLHVLQWRVGCEAEQQGNEFNFSKGIYEFGYDGENFLSFNITTFQWDTFTDAAQETQKNWKHKPMLNPYIIKYLKIDCVDWLKQYIEYADEELRKTSPPDVHMFIKKSTRDKTKLNLTCLATGFYPKDMMVTIRKTQTSLPEHETYSTGIRPNHDGSFQMRMSLEIKKEEKDEYYCNVTHRTLKEPIINIWDGTCYDCPPDISSLMIGVAIGAMIMFAVVAVVLYILKRENVMDIEEGSLQSHHRML